MKFRAPSGGGHGSTCIGGGRHDAPASGRSSRFLWLVGGGGRVGGRGFDSPPLLFCARARTRTRTHAHTRARTLARVLPLARMLLAFASMSRSFALLLCRWTLVVLGVSRPFCFPLGVGRPVRSPRRSQGSLLLDPWGFALTAAFEPAGLSAGSWRVHHDALTHLFYGDALRAGVAGRMEPHGLFADLLPAPVGHQRRARREGLVPDAILDRPRAGADDERCPHLHDLKIIHMCQTHYTQERVLQAAPAQCADARADLVHGGYLRHARALDARHHAGVRDPDA